MRGGHGQTRALAWNWLTWGMGDVMRPGRELLGGRGDQNR